MTTLLSYFLHYLTTFSTEKTMNSHGLYVNNVYITIYKMWCINFFKNSTHMLTGVSPFFVTTNVI